MFLFFLQHTVSFVGIFNNPGGQKNIEVGLFGGFLKNLGTREVILTPLNVVYGLATDISTLIRIAPRVILNSEKTRIAFETEYTFAAYGEGFNKFYVPDSTTPVSNLRALLSIYYFF